ncbi:unnamed protein product [Rotaria magnacalcarata]|uniref:Uncharacterized protein n=1 Tax=Rotaria magnacalcarata TaxID=392030 RepID=A0A815GXX6_9BILA|nr:unnamed protein product [Rotaria magnacalcarata]CAF1346595.1 unnamed protein product [Rotaria magnacalcarata]
MKHSGDDGTFQTNLLQALQKNKVIQDKLTECQHLYYIQLLKELQNYNLKEKYNRELLYSWKKEIYIRKLKKSLEEYECKCFGIRDDYYRSQLKNLDSVITGEQTLVIPPSEEKRRLNIHEKYDQFLKKNPIQLSSSPVRVSKTANVSLDQNKINTYEEKDDKHDNNIKEVDHTYSLEQTWKHIHAQSARAPRGKLNNSLPAIHRSLTMTGIQRNRTSAKTTIPSRVSIISNSPGMKTSRSINSLSGEKVQQSPQLSAQFKQNHSELSDSVEPLIINTQSLGKYTRNDLVDMRSVRRPRKNASDLNLIFETRKRIYQINRRALDYETYQRMTGLQKTIQYIGTKRIDLINDKTNLLVSVDENSPNPSDDKH